MCTTCGCGSGETKIEGEAHGREHRHADAARAESIEENSIRAYFGLTPPETRPNLRSRHVTERLEELLGIVVQMAAENASETLQALRAQWQADAHKQETALSELQNELKLSTPPNRIECYDVSHTQGVATIGAMIPPSLWPTSPIRFGSIAGLVDRSFSAE